MNKPSATLKICIAAAHEAGQSIQKIANEPLEVRDKQDGSPLTRADVASHDIINAALSRVSPACTVVSEEGDQPGESADMDSYWLVDPLDGTKEFVAGLPDYTVNIALIEKGTPVLGVILLPATGVLYYAWQGGGAWRCDPGQEAVRIHAATARSKPVAVVSRSHLSQETSAFLAELGVTEVVAYGSSLKICAVADGRADIYPRLNPTWYWDTAAGAIIAREAGCRITDPNGDPLRYEWQENPKHFGFIVYAPAVCDPFRGAANETA